MAAGKLLGHIAFNPGMILLSLGSREKCIPERAERAGYPNDDHMAGHPTYLPSCMTSRPPPLAFLPFMSADLRTPANDSIFRYS